MQLRRKESFTIAECEGLVFSRCSNDGCCELHDAGGLSLVNSVGQGGKDFANDDKCCSKSFSSSVLPKSGLQQAKVVKMTAFLVVFILPNLRLGYLAHGIIIINSSKPATTY